MSRTAGAGTIATGAARTTALPHTGRQAAAQRLRIIGGFRAILQFLELRYAVGQMIEKNLLALVEISAALPSGTAIRPAAGAGLLRRSATLGAIAAMREGGM
jgi:hypothetical protein